VKPRLGTNQFVRFQDSVRTKNSKVFETAIENASHDSLATERDGHCSQAIVIVGAALLFPLMGRDFFPQVEAGQIEAGMAGARRNPHRKEAETSRGRSQIRRTIGETDQDRCHAR